MKTHYPVSDELREAVDDFFGNAELVYATPHTENHSANFYGDTHVCELTKQDVCNLIQIASGDWTTIDEDGSTIRSISEAEATETILSELQHDKPVDLSGFTLYDSDSNDYVNADDLGVSDEEYEGLVAESVECEQAEGHVRTSKGRRVYAAD